MVLKVYFNCTLNIVFSCLRRTLGMKDIKLLECMQKELQNKAYKNCCLAWRRLRGDFITFYYYLKRGCSKEAVSHRNYLKLHKGMFSMDMRKNFFIESVSKFWNRLPKHWNGLPGEVLESYPWMYLRDMDEG